MSSWREITKPDQPDVLPPLIFPCRWRYGPGNNCDVPVTPPERLCERHQAKDAERLLALRETRSAGQVTA